MSVVHLKRTKYSQLSSLRKRKLTQPTLIQPAIDVYRTIDAVVATPSIPVIPKGWNTVKMRPQNATQWIISKLIKEETAISQSSAELTQLTQVLRLYDLCLQRPVVLAHNNAKRQLRIDVAMKWSVLKHHFLNISKQSVLNDLNTWDHGICGNITTDPIRIVSATDVATILDSFALSPFFLGILCLKHGYRSASQHFFCKATSLECNTWQQFSINTGVKLYRYNEIETQKDYSFSCFSLMFWDNDHLLVSDKAVFASCHGWQTPAIDKYTTVFV